jgi:hypothetical protein
MPNESIVRGTPRTDNLLVAMFWRTFWRLVHNGLESAINARWRWRQRRLRQKRETELRRQLQQMDRRALDDIGIRLLEQEPAMASDAMSHPLLVAIRIAGRD